MSPLESQRLLLVAESELNRAHLVAETAACMAEARALAARAKSLGTVAQTAFAMASALVVLSGKPAAGTIAPRQGWMRRILKGAGLVSSLWMAFRSRHRPDRDNRNPVGVDGKGRAYPG